MENQAFGYRFIYTGYNKFEAPGHPATKTWTLLFDIYSSGDVKLTENFTDIKMVQHTLISMKDK
jgi:hypothetical protein